MICVCLNTSTLTKNTTLREANKQYADLFELRADCLQAHELEWRTLEAWKQTSTQPCIFTLRETQDGGQWDSKNSEKKQQLIHEIVKHSLFEYVDIEILDPSLQENSNIIAEAYKIQKDHNSVSKIILSRHLFTPLQQHSLDTTDKKKASLSHTQIITEIQGYAKQYPKAIIKYAVQCNSSKDFYQFLLAANTLRNDTTQYILIPMGSFGQPARILSHLSSSLWTYCAPKETNSKIKNLGQISAQKLNTLYRYHALELNKKKDLAVFAVIGDPVLHSQSPQFFNIMFREQKKEAVYVHLHMDSLSHIKEIASLLQLKGMSVTVPHKQKIIYTLHNKGNDMVQQCQACNTVLCKNTKWEGYNTDVLGFLHPLLNAFGINYRSKTTENSENSMKRYRGLLKEKRCLIIGAGGAARATIYALLHCDAKILVTNRSTDRAHTLIKDFSINTISFCPLDDYKTFKSWEAEIVVQTTSVGMIDSSSPISNYPFSGNETVYDIIYTVEETNFLQEARAHGSKTIHGKEMFYEQAKEQETLFLQMID